MRIVITGGAGFLGSRLARKLLERGRSPTRADRSARSRRSCCWMTFRAAGFDDRRVTAVTGDLADPATVAHAVTSDTDSVFHLAAVVSGARRGGLRYRHARESRRHARAARALPDVCGAAQVRVHELARRVRRAAARPGARRRAAHAAGFVRRAEGDRRISGLRHDAQRIHRRPLAAPADGHRAAGQAEQGRVVVRERHHSRAARRRRCALSGRARDEDVGAVAARRRSTT